MFQRILVPLDGSSRAECALPVAARIARASGASIILLRVATTPLDEGTHQTHRLPLTRTVVEADIDAATAYLTTLTASDDVDLDGIGIKTVVAPGHAASAFLDVAREEQVDLIVMCGHQETGFKRWFASSVAQNVAQHCPIPVFILREDSPLPLSSYPDRLHPLRPLIGLVALDGSEFAEAALAPAASLVAALAAPARGTLLLTRVVTPPTLDPEHVHREYSSPCMIEQETEDAKLYLGSVAQGLRTGPLGDLNLTIVWSVVVSPDVTGSLIEAATYGEDGEGMRTFGSSDLIAIATHGRAGLQRLTMGSVTCHLLGATKLPLLIVHSTSAGADKDQPPLSGRCPIPQRNVITASDSSRQT